MSGTQYDIVNINVHQLKITITSLDFEGFTFSFESRVPAFGVEYEIAYYYTSDPCRHVNVFQLLFFPFMILHMIAFCNYNTCFDISLYASLRDIDSF